MELTKELLEDLYSKMSLTDIAKHLDMSKSTLYYYMRKLDVKRRSKSDAQRKHLQNLPHQRCGKSHSSDSKEKISNGTRRFWESSDGLDQKARLGELRRNEWDKRSSRQKQSILQKLQSAERPSPGELSKFGKKLVEFLTPLENTKTGIKMTASHVSDIILEDRKVVIELLLPISIYGPEQETKISARYNRLVDELNDLGYRVVIIEDHSNSISNARCQRIYDQLLKFFETKTLQRLTIVS